MFTSAMIYNFILFALFYYTASTAAATKCYNCGTENTVSCEKFDPNNSSFIVECPKKSSCGLETHGNTKVRTCELLYIDDCQKANNIEYCYCTADLCNGNIIQFTPSDDEDLVEGSGTVTTNKPTTTKPIAHVTITNLFNGNSEAARFNRFFVSSFFVLTLANRVLVGIRML